MTYSEEYMHRFLRKQLPDEEMQEFMQELAEDPELKEMLAFERDYLAALLAYDAENFRLEMMEIHESEENENNNNGGGGYPSINLPDEPGIADETGLDPIFESHPLLERMVRGNNMSGHIEQIKIEIVQELYPSITAFLRFNLNQPYLQGLNYEIVDNQNEVISTGTIPAQQQQHQVDISNYNKGLYYWKLMLPDGVCADKFLIR